MDVRIDRCEYCGEEMAFYSDGSCVHLSIPSPEGTCWVICEEAV